MQPTFDNDKFISLMEARPCLWDTSENDYSNKNRKQQCWLEVAKEMIEGFEELTSQNQNECGKELQKKWKSLRNCFARELVKQKNKKSGSVVTWKTYIYFDQMSFLLRCGTNKETTASMASAPSVDSEDANTEDNLLTREIKPKRKRQKTEKTQGASKEVLEVIKGSLKQRELNENRLNEDDDRYFLLSLLGDLKKINPERKLDVKLDLMQAIKRGLAPAQPPLMYSHYYAPQTFAGPSNFNYSNHPTVTSHLRQATPNSTTQQSHLQELHSSVQSSSTQTYNILSPRDSDPSSYNSEDSQIYDILTDYNE